MNVMQCMHLQQKTKKTQCYYRTQCLYIVQVFNGHYHFFLRNCRSVCITDASFQGCLNHLLLYCHCLVTSSLFPPHRHSDNMLKQFCPAQALTQLGSKKHKFEMFRNTSYFSKNVLKDLFQTNYKMLAGSAFSSHCRQLIPASAAWTLSSEQ